MEFLKFLERESQAFDRRVLILGALVAMTNLVVLFALTTAGGKAIQRESNLWELIIVAAGLLTYWFSQGFVLRRMTVVVERIVERIRLRIVDKFGTRTWFRSKISVGHQHIMRFPRTR
jgi:Zn-dependent protease with chaperone function